ncbi:hypothetical protein EVAR_61692_1 [Eumeta japonica]|uniref:Uncharacterized protein n=1 Tax=Eumeta variegata TaxID=151549 RepID=A0A4C1ZMN4_EUMVA|nr:hypothetical protein EVAR_61692_1 [Eumeta japonica]
MTVCGGVAVPLAAYSQHQPGGEPSRLQRRCTDCTGNPWFRRSDLMSSVLKSAGIPRMTALTLRSPRELCGDANKVCSFEQVDGAPLGGALGFAPVLATLSVATCVEVVTGLETVGLLPIDSDSSVPTTVLSESALVFFLGRRGGSQLYLFSLNGRMGPARVLTRSRGGSLARGAARDRCCSTNLSRSPSTRSHVGE